jgi:hypothetical protein
MAAREKYLLGWFPKVARKLGGLSFPIVSPPPSEREGRRRKKKKIRPQQGKKEYGQIEVAVEQVVEGGTTRMQADGFTGGVSLTDRISGGFNIKDGRSSRAEIPADALDGCQDVTASPSCIKQQGERETGPTNNVDLFHRQRLPPLLRHYISLYTPYRHDASECVETS